LNPHSPDYSIGFSTMIAFLTGSGNGKFERPGPPHPGLFPLSRRLRQDATERGAGPVQAVVIGRSLVASLSRGRFRNRAKTKEKSAILRRDRCDMKNAPDLGAFAL
jgi:hypothetical protein